MSEPRGIPYGRLFAAVSLAVLALEIAALIVAVVRRRRVRRQAGDTVPSLRLPGIAGAALIPLIDTGAGTIQAARNIVMDAFDLSRAPWDAGHGITVQIPIFPLVVTAWFAAGLLWIAALWLTLDARRRERRHLAAPQARCRRSRRSLRWACCRRSSASGAGRRSCSAASTRRLRPVGRLGRTTRRCCARPTPPATTWRRSRGPPA